jgi:hypothetical protein
LHKELEGVHELSQTTVVHKPQEIWWHWWTGVCKPVREASSRNLLASCFVNYFVALRTMK